MGGRPSLAFTFTCCDRLTFFNIKSQKEVTVIEQDDTIRTAIVDVKELRWRQRRRWVAVLFGFALVSFLVAVWVASGTLVASANRKVGDPPADFPARAVQIESESGAKLAAWHLAVADSSATAILFHPLRGDRRSMLSRARLLQEYGYSILVVDLQAHGESSGNTITFGHLEKYDVLASIKYIRSHDPVQKIVIVGRSLGAASALLAEADVDAIVVESVYPTIEEAVQNRTQMHLGLFHRIAAPLLLLQLDYRLGISPDQLCPIGHLGQIDAPILIAAGDQDQHTTMAESRRIFQLARVPKCLVVFEGAGHVDLLAFDRKKYEEEIVVNFLNQIVGVHEEEDQNQLDEY